MPMPMPVGGKILRRGSSRRLPQLISIITCTQPNAGESRRTVDSLLSRLLSSFHSSRLIPGVQLSVGASFLFPGLHSGSRCFSFSNIHISFFFFFFTFVHRFVIPHCHCFGRIVMGSRVCDSGPGRVVVSFPTSTSTSVHCILYMQFARNYLRTLSKRWRDDSNEWLGGWYRVV